MNPALSALKNVAALLALLVLGTGSGLLANKLGEHNSRYKFPTHIPWQQKWNNRVLEEAQRMGLKIADIEQVARVVETGEMLIVDGRKQTAYDAGHIPTAIPLPVIDFENEFMNYPGFPDEPVIIYCSGANCDESLKLAEKMQEQGFTNLTIFVGGYSEWKAANREVE